MSRHDAPVIRPPTDADASALAGLFGELGYPATPDQVVPRLAVLRAEPAHTMTWVAELDGRVVGSASVRVFAALHVTAPVAWLIQLVVASDVRGRGIGRALVHEAEQWARAKGSPRMSLTSGVQRAEAHEFYKRLGYEQTGVRLTKVF